MNNKLLFIAICMGTQALYGAKRVDVPQVGQIVAEQAAEAQERALSLQATITADRERQEALRAQAMNVSRKLLEQSRALQAEAQRADLPETDRAALRQNMEQYAQRLEEEAGGRISAYSGQMPQRLRRAARSLRSSAQGLSGIRPSAHVSFLEPRRRNLGQTFATMPRTEADTDSDVETNLIPRTINYGSDTSDSE